MDAQHSVKKPLLTRCTYGIVWTARMGSNTNAVKPNIPTLHVGMLDFTPDGDMQCGRCGFSAVCPSIDGACHPIPPTENKEKAS